MVGPAASLRQHPEAHWPLCPAGPCSAQESMGTSPQQPGQRAAAGTDRLGQQHNLQRDGRVVRPRGASPQTQEGLCWTKPQLRHRARGPWHTAPTVHCGSQRAAWDLGPRGAMVVAGSTGCLPWHACPSTPPLFTLPIAQCVLTLCAYKHRKQTRRGEGHRRRGEARQGKPCLLPPRSAADRSPFSNQDGPIWARS